MFARLLAEPGVEEVLDLRSRFGFLAFHGGSLEEHTDTLAAEAARRAGASLYAVVLPEGLQWHVPSRLVVRDESDALGRFLDHVDVAVALHGYGRRGRWTSLLLGGTNRDLAGHLASHLAAALPHYEAVDELDDIPVELRGLHPRNPVNQVRRGGVQLELPPRVRRTEPDAAALVAALAAAAASWPASSSS